MKIQAIPLLIISLISMFSCTKNEYDDLFPESENYRLIKVLNYNNSSDSEPSTFMDLEYTVNGKLERELLYDYPSTLFT